MKHHKGSMKENKPARPSSAGPTEARHEDAEYWEDRAERTRNQARRYEQPAIRDHFAKIAAGYEELARRAREIGIEADKAPQTGSGQRDLAKAPDKYGSSSERERVMDALEDDEVKEVLRASRKRSRNDLSR